MSHWSRYRAPVRERIKQQILDTLGSFSLGLTAADLAEQLDYPSTFQRALAELVASSAITSEMREVCRHVRGRDQWKSAEVFVLTKPEGGAHARVLEGLPD